MQHQLPYTKPWLANEDDRGVNAPLIHQQTISRLHFGLGLHYYQQHTIPYEPLTETMLSEESGPTPDLILYDAVNGQSPIIIEISGRRGFKSDLRKVIKLVEEEEYGILESFVYNYNTKQWLRYGKGDGRIATESSFSDILQLDLNSFL